MQHVQKRCWNAIRQQLCGSPDMIGHACGHRWCGGAPTAFRAVATGRFRGTQRLPQALVRQHQMTVSQREPQLLFQLGQLFAKGVGFARQAPVVLPQREVVPLDKARVNGSAGRQGVESSRNGISITKYHLGGHADDFPSFALLNHLSVEQLRGRHAAARRKLAAVALPGWLMPLPVDMQQRGAIRCQRVAGKDKECLP